MSSVLQSKWKRRRGAGAGGRGGGMGGEEGKGDDKEDEKKKKACDQVGKTEPSTQWLFQSKV